MASSTPEIPGLFDDLPENPDAEQIARITLKNWREHLKAVGLLESQITKLLDEAVKEAARLGKRIKPEDIGRAFSKNPSLRKNLDSTMQRLAEDLTATIEQGSKDAWLRSNATGTAIIAQMAAGNAALATLLQSQQNKAQNDRALLSFRQREVAGMNLSERVWKLVGDAQRDMERAVEVALAEGTPATKLSKRVRELLQEPHRLYRRVRDKDGNLRLSQAARQYHPGRGVYRSSYKNAMRLARTEVNMAYHTADNERWKTSWWVRGIRIGLSNNHTVQDSKGKTVPLIDICDELAGDYPADFKFTGWHPQCRCIATAITCSYDDIRDYYRRKRAGEDMTGYTPPGTIKEPPAEFKNWLATNADRLAGAAERGTTPYFIRDNAKYTDPNYKPPTPAAAKAEPRQEPTQPQPATTMELRKPKVKASPLVEEFIAETGNGKYNSRYSSIHQAVADWQEGMTSSNTLMQLTENSTYTGELYRAITLSPAAAQKFRMAMANSKKDVTQVISRGDDHISWTKSDSVARTGYGAPSGQDTERFVLKIKNTTLRGYDTTQADVWGTAPSQEVILSKHTRLKFIGGRVRTDELGKYTEYIVEPINEMKKVKVAEPPKKTIAEIAAERHANRDTAEIQRRWNNRRTYHQLSADPNYRDVEFSYDTGGLRATHIDHNFDRHKGKYETSAQAIGYKSGDAVILGKEDHTTHRKRNTEGTYNGYQFEIAGAENGSARNIRNAIKHCVSKPTAEIAVIFLPEGATQSMIEQGLRAYNGLKGKEGQWRRFREIIFMDENGIQKRYRP